MESFGESLAHPLGRGATCGPIDPPAFRSPRRNRSRWVALGAFAIVGTTSIMAISAYRSDANVTLVAVADHACTGCERTRGLIESLRDTFGERLNIVFDLRSARELVQLGVAGPAFFIDGQLVDDPSTLKLAIGQALSKAR